MYSSFRKDKKDDGEDGGSAVSAFANLEKTAVLQASPIMLYLPDYRVRQVFVN